MAQKITISGKGDIVVVIDNNEEKKHRKSASTDKYEKEIDLTHETHMSDIRWKANGGCHFSVKISSSTLSYAHTVVDGNEMDSDMVEFDIFV